MSCVRILWLLLLSCSLHCVRSQSNFNKSCFDDLKKSDADGNGSLNPNEFMAFLLAYTRGIARSPVPPDLVKVFMGSIDPSTQQVPIRGTFDGADAQSKAATSSLCNNVNLVIRSLLNSAAPPKKCMAALMAADTTPPKGEISKFPEYLAFLSNLIGSQLTQTSFEQLSILTKTAYENMAIGGVVSGSAGTQYLVEFCSRALTGYRLDEIADKLDPPAPAPAEEDPIVTEDTTANGDTQETASVNATETADLGNSTSAEPTPANETTAEEPQTEQEMSDLFFERCKGSMLFIDKDRDSKLSKREFGALIDRLQKEVDGTLSYKDAKPFYDDTFDNEMRQSDSDPSIRGAKPAQIPSDEDVKNLKFVCQTTYQAMIESSTSQPDEEDDVSSGMMKQAGKMAPIDAAYFSNCRRSMYIADGDRNKGMDVDEFVEFAERLSPKKLYLTDFGDLDKELQDIYKAFTTYLHLNNQFMINVSGSKPASRATDTEMEHMEALCETMNASFSPIDE